MTYTELFDKLDGHETLEGVGLLGTDKGPAAVIKHKPTGLTTQFPLEAIENIEWTMLEPVLIGVREPAVLHHLSRVVGYFSRIENWNESKLGELRDRRKGTYTLAES